MSKLLFGKNKMDAFEFPAQVRFQAPTVPRKGLA